MAEVFTQQIGYGLWLYGYETDQATSKTRAIIINSADRTNTPLFTVLTSGGVSTPTTRIVLSSTGASFTVPRGTLGSTGTSFNVL